MLDYFCMKYNSNEVSKVYYKDVVLPIFIVSTKIFNEL